MTYTLTMGKSHRWAANEERKAGVSEVGTLSGLNTWGNLISTEPTWIRHVTSVQRVCSICGTTSASCCALGWHPWYQCCVEHVRQTYSTEPTWIRHVTSLRSVTRGFHMRYNKQCCGAEIISFGSGSDSGSAEPQIFLSAPAPQSRKSELWLRIILQNTLKITLLDLSNRIKIVTIHKNFFSNHNFFYPPLSAPAPQHWFYVFTKICFSSAPLKIFGDLSKVGD